MAYFCTKQFSEQYSVSIKYDDKTLAIKWEIDKIIVSDKDKYAQSFANLDSKFIYTIEKD